MNPLKEASEKHKHGIVEREISHKVIDLKAIRTANKQHCSLCFVEEASKCITKAG